MYIILIIAGIVGFVYLSGRIQALEEQVAQLLNAERAPHRGAFPNEQPSNISPEQTEGGYWQDRSSEKLQMPEQVFDTSGFTPPSSEPAAAYAQQSMATEPNQFMEWLKEDLFMKLGALLLLIAFGWFVSYAFMNNWIGPMGRIVLGLLMGLIFMMLGLWRIQTRLHQGSIFTVLGSTTVLLTIFAARGIYEFFTPEIALGVMFLSVVFVALVAVKYRRQQLALAGLILGGIAPLLTNTDPNVFGIFSYLLILVVGSLWVMYAIDAIALPLAAFFIVTAYGFPYLLGFMTGGDSAIALLFAFVFTIIFFVSNIVSILKRTDDESRVVHLLLALGTGLYLTAWIAFAVDPEWRSLMDVAWALAFAFGAFVVYLRTSDRVPFYIYSAVALGLIAIATAAELSGPVLSIAYTVEVTALLIAGSVIFKDYSLINKIGGLYVGPIVLSLADMGARSWRDGFLHAEFFSLSILMLCLWISAVVIYDRRPKDEEMTGDGATILGVMGGIYAVILCWLITHSVFPDDLATGVSLFIYTASGIVMYVMGQAAGKPVLRVVGGTLVGLVVGRLLLVDVWAMALAGRIVTFFVIGILLISTAFITKMRKDHDAV